MLSAILIILTLPFTDFSKFRGLQNRPLHKIGFIYFIVILIGLTVIGGKHVESPFITIGQVLTALYFSYFLILVPFISILESGENNERCHYKY